MISAEHPVTFRGADAIADLTLTWDRGDRSTGDLPGYDATLNGIETDEGRVSRRDVLATEGHRWIAAIEAEAAQAAADGLCYGDRP